MTLKELRARLAEIGLLSKTAKGEDLQKLFDEAFEIQNQIDEAVTRKSIDNVAKEYVGEPQEFEKNTLTQKATRGKALKANEKVFYGAQSITKAMTTANVALPQHTARGVSPTFNPVSSIVDMVKPVALAGGDSYKRTYTKDYGTGGYTVENSPATTAEPKTGVAEIAKTKITAYAEEPEEMMKLGDGSFDDFVGTSVETATRRKLSHEIMVGTGATNRLRGIFHNPTAEDEQVIDPQKDLSIALIDADTLDNIIFSYGGDEHTEGNATLILSKEDLKAFSLVKDKQGRKVYKIDQVNKTIDTIPYIINSACGILSKTETEVSAYCMAYGNLQNYELAIFSDLEVSRSTEYKFKEGQICFKAGIFVGGNVTAYNGFVRVKKGATA